MVEEGRIEEVTVGSVLRSSEKGLRPATVGESASLRDAIDAILRSETRKVYVLDGEGRVVGTITFETLLRHAGYRLGVRKSGITSFLKMLGEIGGEKVTEVMITPAKVLEDELLVNATRLMVEHHLNDLPVVDGDGRLVGELNGLDILRMSITVWS